MIYLDKLPNELFHLLVPSLNAFELSSLLAVCPYRGSFHQFRQGHYASNEDRLVGLIQALRAGRLDLVQQAPKLPQLLEDFDDFANFADVPDNKKFFGGNELLARSVAGGDFNGYINPLIIAINQISSSAPELRLQIVQYLLNKGAKTDIPDRFHRRVPLYVAAERGNPEIVLLLLQNQASQNYVSRVGRHWRLPLDAAFEQNHFEIVELLLNRGGDFMTRPFHRPALKRRDKSVRSMEILNMLITRGHYQITDEELLVVIRWMLPDINLPSRRSQRSQKNRDARVLTTSSAAPLITCLRSENFASMWNEALHSDLGLACYSDMISGLK